MWSTMINVRVTNSTRNEVGIYLDKTNIHSQTLLATFWMCMRGERKPNGSTVFLLNESTARLKLRLTVTRRHSARRPSETYLLPFILNSLSINICNHLSILHVQHERVVHELVLHAGIIWFTVTTHFDRNWLQQTRPNKHVFQKCTKNYSITHLFVCSLGHLRTDANQGAFTCFEWFENILERLKKALFTFFLVPMFNFVVSFLYSIWNDALHGTDF